MSTATATLLPPHVQTPSVSHPLSRQALRQHLKVISNPHSTRPLFQWDASRNLSERELLEHRERFPRFTCERPELSALPDAGSWSANLAIGLVEIFFHQRPIAQIERWVITPLYHALIAQMDRLAMQKQAHTPIKVTSYRTCMISERIAECCVILDAHGMRRNISMKLEGHRGKWIATGLQIL